MGGVTAAWRSPRPYSRHCGEIVAGMQQRLSFAPTRGINGNGEWEDNDATPTNIYAIAGINGKRR